MFGGNLTKEEAEDFVNKSLKFITKIKKMED